VQALVVLPLLALMVLLVLWLCALSWQPCSRPLQRLLLRPMQVVQARAGLTSLAAQRSTTAQVRPGAL
jgi:hypothetical protein